ncbi:hypothetical protein LCGC14_2412030, partial [marine sediment metagenome]
AGAGAGGTLCKKNCPSDAISIES